MIPTGKSLGRYEIRSLLGKGGMGEVYLAYDPSLRRQVAIKLLPADVTQDKVRLSRFEREAHAASSLNHPNILTIHEIGRQVDLHFIATEYIEGESLRQFMTRTSTELREVLDVTSQVASALSAAHHAGIVHRDIKPENVMVRRDGFVKVLDFGLAKAAEETAAVKRAVVGNEAPTRMAVVNTEPGIVMGTVSYMSPEQVRGVQVDARTDIWSLGVVIYEMVAGRLPFEGATTSDVMASILKIEPPILTKYAPEIPVELERIVTKALRKDPEERYQVVKDLALDLKSLKQHLEFEAELERTASPEKRTSEASQAATGGPVAETTRMAAAHTGGAADIHPTSSVEYVVGEIRRHKRAALVVLATLVASAVVVAFLAYSRYFAESNATRIRSIAVLPFVNASNNPDAEYLTDGVSESLINRLSQLPGIKVIARSSSFQYKGKDTDLQEVARALGVEAILTGRVAQRGDDLLISAELVDGRDKTQVWGEQYNRKAADLLAVQSEISREIAEKLRLHLSPNDQQQLTKRDTANPQAYELLLRGRFHYNRGEEKKAVEYYQQAITLDPTYARAHAALAVAYRTLAASGILDPREYLPRAEAEARMALDLDANQAEAHYALALVRQGGWQWAEAERGYKRALELNPNLAEARVFYSHYLSLMGRHDEAIAEIKRAKEVDPLSLVVNARVGYRFFFARRYDEAIAEYRKTLELDPGYSRAHVLLGYAYVAKGRYAEAIAAYQEGIKLGEEGEAMQIYLGEAYAKGGERARAQSILKRLQTSKEYVSHGELATLYLSLGEREQALASLERAYAAHDVQLQYLGVDPSLDSLRSDPRFQDLMHRVGLAS